MDTRYNRAPAGGTNPNLPTRLLMHAICYSFKEWRVTIFIPQELKAILLSL